MFSAIFYGLRCLVWFPFAVVANVGVLVAVNVAGYFFWPEIWNMTLLTTIILCGLAIPIEHTLRPAPRTPKLQGPPREKPIIPQLAALLLKAKGQAPSLAHARRGLSKELRALLAAPVTRPPEAVLHEQAVVKQLAAQAGRKAA